MTSAFSFQNVNLSFDKSQVLIDINLDVPEKEFLGIIGPNGGGKSTLLKTLLGLLTPNSGKVEIFGKPVKENRKLLGYVPQYSNFPKDYPISVKEVIQMGRLGNKNSKSSAKKISDLLDQVGLGGFEKRTVTELSGGEKQRVLIARALATEPKILLLDEPTASIDIKAGQNFYDLMHQLNEEMTIVLVSHDIGAISQYVKKIACLNKTLVYHDSKEISKEMLESTYQCPVDLIAHGVPHRVLDDHCEC